MSSLEIKVIGNKEENRTVGENVLVSGYEK
ncbi:hypothetical protein EDD69_12418 [Thermolongibacillus altinsuensis]|uniref:Uncharacterized protein n=1 Tax=Thermolongibacillus altinsuensis TaxID=575256 RepID=A0A4R1Q7S3_9BACL|nr:hypothetical protein EDD69_12418 [Thermolongibacillus altinsuensis]